MNKTHLAGTLWGLIGGIVGAYVLGHVAPPAVFGSF
jgi:hypothetical protein